MADAGNGATLTRSGFTVDVVSISIGAQTVDILDISNLSTTGYIKKVAADLAATNEITVEWNFDATDTDQMPTVGGAAVSTVVTWPIHDTGNTTNSTLTGTAYITELKPPDFRNNELQVASITFKFDGGSTKPTWVVESA